jgi:hypothetical protein
LTVLIISRKFTGLLKAFFLFSSGFQTGIGDLDDFSTQIVMSSSSAAQKSNGKKTVPEKTVPEKPRIVVV